MSETIDLINELQRRILRGEDPPASEMRAALTQLRGERVVAAKASKEKKERSAHIDLESLLGTVLK